MTHGFNPRDAIRRQRRDIMRKSSAPG